MVLIEEVSDSDLNEAAVVLAASPAASAEQTQQDDVNDEDGQRAEGTGTGATVEEMIEKERTEYEEARNDFYQKQVLFFGGSDGGDVITRLRACAAYDDRQLDLDPTLEQRLRELEADPGRLGLYSADPRIMQAICALQGMELEVTEADLKKAERDGHAPDLPPITLNHHQRARDMCATREEAKAAGNEHFKANRLEDALACYLRAVDLCSSSDADYGSFAPTVYGNLALVYFKLRRYRKAEGACSVGIQVAGAEMNLSKLYYRRAQAREQLRRPQEAAGDMRRSYEEAQRAVDTEVARIRQCGSALARRQPLAQQSVKSLQAELPRLEQQLNRLDAVVVRIKEGEVVKIQQHAREKEQEVLCVSGQRLSDTRRRRGRPEADQGAKLPYAPGVISEKDWSFWMKARLVEMLVGAQHWLANGGSIKILSVDAARSEVNATIKIKEGRRALYYDMDLTIVWEAVVQSTDVATASDSTTWHRTRGVLRLYNIGQDTEYRPGGDPTTSYMYSLGFTTEKGDWMELVKEEATELFHIAAQQIGLVILELQGKSAH